MSAETERRLLELAAAAHDELRTVRRIATVYGGNLTEYDWSANTQHQADIEDFLIQLTLARYETPKETD